MRLHLAYAGDPHNDARHAPYTITRNLYRALSTKYDVRYYDWCHTGPTDFQDGDIYIGHPNYPPETVTQRAFASGVKWKAKCTIHPLHTKMEADNMPFDHLARAADAVFAIQGPFWYDEMDRGPFAHWKPKTTRLDMAVDAGQFPFLKERFNDPGKRSLLYIGSSIPNKNIGLMARIMAQLPDVKLYWYGADGGHHICKLPNVIPIGWQDLNPSVAADICSKCDFFLNTSISDANPTTLLESTCWGIIPIVTKESGYYSGDRCHGIFENIPSDSVDICVATLRRFLCETSSDELKKRAVASRAAVEKHYNWDVFCGKVLHQLQILDR